MNTRKLAFIPALAAALTLAAALPAQAATSYSTVSITTASGASDVAAVDPSTGLIYRAGTATDTDPGTGITWDHPTIQVVNPKTKTVTKTISLDTGVQYEDQGSLLEIKVRPESHTIWAIGTGDPWDCGLLWQINGTTNTVVRHVGAGGGTSDCGYGDSVALEQTADVAYWTTSATYDVNQGETACVLQYPGTLHSIDATTGAQKSVTLPSPATVKPANIGSCEAIGTDLQWFNRVAFDQANHSLQVAGTGYLWAYSNKLVLAHTLRLPFGQDQSDRLGVTANGTTNTVYVSDGAALSVVNGATGAITANRTYTRGGLPVLDAAANRLYLGDIAVNTADLGRIGTLPYRAAAVNTSDHTTVSVDTTTVYDTTSKG